MRGIDLAKRPIHLGLGAKAEVEPVFTGAMDWYDTYVKRHEADGAEGRLVSLHSFTSSWDVWEMHPHGAEVVVCTSGTLRLHQQRADGTSACLILGPGEFAINEPGTWHTADVDGTATALFITAGLGTRHRPR